MVKLLLLTGLATVEDRELLDVELVVVREDVVLVAANNLLVVLVGEDVVAPGEEIGAVWAAWYLAARISSHITLPFSREAVRLIGREGLMMVVREMSRLWTIIQPQFSLSIIHKNVHSSLA